VRQRCDSSVSSDAHYRQTTSLVGWLPHELTVALVDPADAQSHSRRTAPPPTPTTGVTVRPAAATVVRRAAGRDAGIRGTRRPSACRRCSRDVAVAPTTTQGDVADRATMTTTQGNDDDAGRRRQHRTTWITEQRRRRRRATTTTQDDLDHRATTTQGDVADRVTLTAECVRHCRCCRKDEIVASDLRLASFV